MGTFVDGLIVVEPLLLPDEDCWVTTTDDKNESNELWVSEILDCSLSADAKSFCCLANRSSYWVCKVYCSFCWETIFAFTVSIVAFWDSTCFFSSAIFLLILYRIEWFHWHYQFLKRNQRSLKHQK